MLKRPRLLNNPHNSKTEEAELSAVIVRRYFMKYVSCGDSQCRSFKKILKS